MDSCFIPECVFSEYLAEFSPKVSGGVNGTCSKESGKELIVGMGNAHLGNQSAAD